MTAAIVALTLLAVLLFGRVLLSVPGGWEWLIEAAWNTIITNVPSGYELVVRPGYRRLPEPVLPLPLVRHAA